MKKAFVILTLVGAALIMSSCVKTCNCKTRVDGEVVLENTIELKEGEKCGDFNSSASGFGHNGSVRCTPILF